jgi:hypothetical protein
MKNENENENTEYYIKFTGNIVALNRVLKFFNPAGSLGTFCLEPKAIYTKVE